MSVLHVNQQSFRSVVLDSQETVLLDFWATWCGPCRMIAPILEQIAEEHPEIKVCKINVDEEPELANAFRVESIPTLVVMKNGKPVNRAVGLMPKAKVLELL